mmetsp:Transcript_37772/g.108110  ORF Transcript_37772/g.108110 Transcript_37772/m.108110 type:complete len:145 (-) Transcript_37772:43-477(-)
MSKLVSSKKQICEHVGPDGRRDPSSVAGSDPFAQDSASGPTCIWAIPASRLHKASNMVPEEHTRSVSVGQCCTDTQIDEEGSTGTLCDNRRSSCSAASIGEDSSRHGKEIIVRLGSICDDSSRHGKELIVRLGKEVIVTSTPTA